MRLFSITILTLLMLIACVERKEGEIKPTIASNLISISDNEDKGIKEILRYYDGLCKYSIGFEGNVDYFHLNMSKCDFFKMFPDELENSAKNIAFLFFKNLKSERKKYNEIRVTITLDSGVKHSFEIKSNELSLVDLEMKKVNQLISFLKNDNYVKIEEMLSDERFEKISKSDFLIRIQKVNPEFGEITDFMHDGYEIEKKDGRNILHVKGSLIRSIQPSEFSVDIDLENKNEKILSFNYQK